MTSAHTSLEAARAPARSPLAALAQIPSTLLLTLAGSVGSCSTIDLQSAAYSATPAAPDALVDVAVEGVEVVVAEAGVLGADFVVAIGVVVDELVVELLPHPATSAPQSAATTSSGDRLAIIDPPSVWKNARCWTFEPPGERLVAQG
jgi:hypothetical protein